MIEKKIILGKELQNTQNNSSQKSSRRVKTNFNKIVNDYNNDISLVLLEFVSLSLDYYYFLKF